MLLSSVIGFITIFISVDYVQLTYLNDNNWDILIFTQNWPQTVCKEWKEKGHTHTCTLPSKQDAWTIHGIWPTKFGTIGPAFCNRSWLFDPEEVRPIENYLTQLWTNVETETLTYGLWSHEWNKHGTCAAVLEPLNSELKYFSKGLELMTKYMMTNILNDAGIIPSNEKQYDVQDFHNAIKNSLGVNPMIVCRKEDGKNFLMESRICFNKQLELTDCNGIVSEEQDMLYDTILTNCDTSKGVIYLRDSTYDERAQIIYLEEPPKRIYVQLYKLASWLQWFTL